MNIILFTHPNFIKHQSMPRFANMIAEGMKERGHNVKLWAPAAYLFRDAMPEKFKKWFGYFDQYVLFPRVVAKEMKKCAPDTLFVFSDHALGPWIPLVKNRPHVVHCHDFIAQRSAQNEIDESRISWTGKQYQHYIRRGYSKAKNFISVSEKTKKDLHRFLTSTPHLSEVVYNGLNRSFQPFDTHQSRSELSAKTGISLNNGYILHVGGNQWYKNRPGVVEIFNSWRSRYNNPLPLLMVGEAPDPSLSASYNESPYKSDIHFLTQSNDGDVQLAYAGADLLLFPSLDEGFGWPIVEAMASGCPVITTREAPMTEVGGNAAFFIPRRPDSKVDALAWANSASKVINDVIVLSAEERKDVVRTSITNSKRFDKEVALDKIEFIYSEVLQQC